MLALVLVLVGLAPLTAANLESGECSGNNYDECVEPCVSRRATCEKPEYKGSMSTYFTPEALDTDAWKAAPFYACCKHPLRLQCAENTDGVALNRVCAENAEDGAMVCPMVGACQKTCRCVARKPTQCRAGDHFFENMAKCGPMTGLGCERGHASVGNDPPLYVRVEGFRQSPFEDSRPNNALAEALAKPSLLCNVTVPIVAAATSSESIHDNIICSLQGLAQLQATQFRRTAHVMVSVYAPCYQKSMVTTMGNSTGFAVARCTLSDLQAGGTLADALTAGFEVTIEADRYYQGTLAGTRMIGNVHSCAVTASATAGQNRMRLVINGGPRQARLGGLLLFLVAAAAAAPATALSVGFSEAW